jgi:ATP-dependent RNA helicase DDX3X
MMSEEITATLDGLVLENKRYVPPHMRGSAQPKEQNRTVAAMLQKAPARVHQQSSFNSGGSGGSFGGRGRFQRSKDPSDEFYSRPHVQGRDPRREEELYGTIQNSGINFDRYEDIPVEVSGHEVVPIINFQDSTMDPLAKSNVKLAGYNNATPVQRYAVAVVTEGRDLMACAQTGSGKVFFLNIRLLRSSFQSLASCLKMDREMHHRLIVVR